MLVSNKNLRTLCMCVWRDWTSPCSDDIAAIADESSLVSFSASEGSMLGSSMSGVDLTWVRRKEAVPWM